MIMDTGKLGMTSEIASRLLNDYRARPGNYMVDVLNMGPIWSLQKQVLDSIPRAIKEHKQIYVGSGHALGKDFISAGIALWFLDCYNPSIVIETAPTDRQVKKVMYGETLKHWNKRSAEWGGEAFRTPYIEITHGEHYLLGFTTKETGASKDASGGKFQGFHSNNVCVIVSEAQAVEDDIYDQIDAITTAENNLIIFIGNPTRARGRFAKGLKDKERNIVFNFSCLDNPNYKQKRIVIPGLSTYEWVEDKRSKWGEADPRWYGRVLGQIPKTSINNVFSQEMIDRVKNLKDTHGLAHNSGTAMDVAGEGIDYNVIMSGTRGVVKNTIARTQGSPSLNAIECQHECEKVEGNFIVVDCDGLGIGTWQELNKITGIGDKFHLIKYHGCSAVKNPLTRKDIGFQNLRALATWTARERLEKGLANIPDDDELIEELLEIEFFENNRGLIQIEDKDDIKDRLGRSPDKADCWIMLQWGFSQKYDLIRKKKSLTYNFETFGREVYPFNSATV